MDHDVPEAEGGATTLDNLNLAHTSCNRAKRAAGSKKIRPYLKFSRYLAKKAARIKYDGALEFFGIEPKAIVVVEEAGNVRFEFAEGDDRIVPIMSEENETGTFRYAFVDVPRSAIFNDDECQPRAVKKEQIAAIFTDLRRNPLHEPPSVRLSSDPAEPSKKRLLMFDGQHKTIAVWLMGRERVVVKVYMDLTAEAAIELVNSIQAKIKKLPLSPFELASKLSEEWEDKLADYEKATGEDKASEAGFIAWLPPDDRRRAKDAFKAALVQRLLSNPDLRLPQYAKGAKKGAIVGLTEQGIRTKVLEKLVHTDPLDEKGESLSRLRDEEASNIVTVLNHLTDQAIDPAGEPGATDVEKERAKRLSYQQSLAYAASLIKDLWQNVAMKSGSTKFVLSDDLTEDQWARILAGVDRLVAHPVWTSAWDGDAMQDLKVALEKNQQARAAFESLALDLPYLLTGDKYPAYKKAWEGKLAAP